MSVERWQEVGRLFHEALKLDAENRSLYLDAMCGTDAALKDEVQSLLRFDADGAQFLERPAIEQAARELAADGTLRPQPTRIAGYTIVKEIGEGGMGVVYLAEQDPPIRRRVALKCMRLERRSMGTRTS
jgi:serine/threonine protein kinase